MFRNGLYILFSPVILMGLWIPPFVVLAQGGSIEPPVETSSTTTSVPTTTGTVATSSSPRPTESQPSVSTSTPSAPRATPPPTFVVPVSSNKATTTAPSEVEESPSTSDTGTNPILWIALAIFAILPFGYLIAQSLKKKKTKEGKEDTSRCFDIKKLLDEKMKELTDLKGRLKNEAQNAVREAIRTEVQGTTTGNALALIEKTGKEYGRLKRLYEECMVEFGGQMFRGTIIQQSLTDTKILDKVKIKETREPEGRVLHDVLIDTNHIPELSKYLASGPWYVRLQKPGADEAKIVFKDKVFTITLSDTRTWADAIAHGISVGVPREQLNFSAN